MLDMLESNKYPYKVCKFKKRATFKWVLPMIEHLLLGSDFSMSTRSVHKLNDDV